MGIISNAKEIADLVKKYNDQDLYQKIILLREEILEIREENISLKERIKELEDLSSVKSKLIRSENTYIMEDDPEGKKGLYCMTCWDYEGKLVNLIKGAYGILRCDICSARKK